MYFYSFQQELSAKHKEGKNGKVLACS
jgi:hypothetical protein